MKYYLHDTSAIEDEKVNELFIEFGYEGVGLFYVLLEKIAKQEKPIKTNVLKHQLKIGKKLEKCWTFMENIGLIHSNNGETFNKQLLNFSEKYQIKKEKNKERVSQWRENQTNKENVTNYESVRNTTKVKESKVKESKVKEISITEPKVSVEKEDIFYKKYVEIWFSFFEEKYQFKPAFNSANGKKIKSIIKKLENLSKEKNFEFDEENAKKSFLRLLNLAYSDEWLRNNFELSNIDSKFNSIIQKSTPNATKSNNDLLREKILRGDL